MMALKKSILACVVLMISLAGVAQPDTLKAPYQRFPQLPAFQLLLGDSVTFLKKEMLPKGKPVLLLIFSPECTHCQHTAEQLVQYKDSVQNIVIVMATMHSISLMNAFAEKYGLKDLPNVFLGKDIYYTLPSFYRISNLPYMALYNAKGNLIRTVEGSLPINVVARIFQKELH